MDIGVLINNYRKLNNLSMEEFAEKCGLSKGYISQLEKGYNPRNNKPFSPALSTYAKISKGMNIELDSLLSKIKNNSLVNLKNEPSDNRNRILSYYDKLSDAAQKQLLQRAEELEKLDNIK